MMSTQKKFLVHHTINFTPHTAFFVSMKADTTEYCYNGSKEMSHSVRGLVGETGVETLLWIVFIVATPIQGVCRHTMS